jgi:hypothetical protein
MKLAEEFLNLLAFLVRVWPERLLFQLRLICYRPIGSCDLRAYFERRTLNSTNALNYGRN